MSGAYGNRFLAPTFCWHVEQTVRKAFFDQESADHYFKARELEAKGRFLAARPKWEAVLAKADLDPFDPFRENFSIDISCDPGWTEKIEVTPKRSRPRWMI